MNYSIREFWSARFGDVARESTNTFAAAGWSIEHEPSPSFVEAELRLRTDYDDLAAPVWLVAAPGAVGKSTLAKEISAETGAVYLDLARAETVAGNYLTGGLVKNGLYDAWRHEKTTVLIDALDEARLRVTQGSFEDFLTDVQTLSKGRHVPTVLFGRVGIIEEAWLILSDRGLDCPVFDIEFFDEPRSVKFVMASLDRSAKRSGNESLATSLLSHRPIYERAATRFVSGLQHASAADGRRFAGYAPVLEAVATALAGITNPATVSETVEQAIRGKILQDIPDRILERESVKLRSQLAGRIPDDKMSGIYTPDEQLDRLAAIVLGTPAPPAPRDLEPEHLSIYDEAIKALVSQHPFLDGTGHEPSGAVFAAVIYVHALFSSIPECVSAAERRAGNGPHTPNPFLVEFYLSHEAKRGKRDFIVPPEHVILLYDSIRARSEAGDIVRLTIDADEDEEAADVEIQIGSASAGPNDRPKYINLKTSQAGSLRFGRQVTGVSVDAPNLDVVIGAGNPVEIVAPVSMNVGRLSFNCPEVVVVSSDKASMNEDASVLLEARELRETTVTSVPQLRKGVELQVAWPGAAAYPWSRFVTNADRVERQDLDPALRGLRRLVMAFRSHSRGRLARYKGKIEHARITKGALGDAIRRQMVNDRILSLEDSIYFLDPDALGRIVGASYQDLKLKRFNDRVREYVAAIR